LILLSDAAVLIDLGYVGGLKLLAQIAPTEVLDVVLQECEDDRQPDLVDDVTAAGVQVVTTQATWVEAASGYKSAALSLPDRLNLHYAKTFDRLLLATDNPLRKRCEREGVKVHGSLWLVEEAFKRSLVRPGELCHWLELWHTVGSRLPPQEKRHLESMLGC
jgi:hypothetical protein